MALLKIQNTLKSENDGEKIIGLGRKFLMPKTGGKEHYEDLKPISVPSAENPQAELTGITKTKTPKIITPQMLPSFAVSATWPPTGIKPYYCDESVCIIHGDCREILPTLPKVDLVLTDPPYEKEAHAAMRRTRSVVEGRLEVTDMGFKAIDETTRAFICALECKWLLAFCQAEAVGKYQELLGAKYRRPMVWIKPNSSPQFTGDRPAMGYESIVCAWMTTGKSVWNGGGRRGVFTVNSTGYDHEHPAQKPVRLMTDLIQLFSNGGETILDPFMGSGTTLRAAKDLKRKAIGIEIEEKYCEIAALRMRQEVLL